MALEYFKSISIVLKRFQTQK